MTADSRKSDLAEGWEIDSNDRVAWWFIASSACWWFFGCLTLAFTWLVLVQPDAFAIEYTFARIRPLHWNVILFAGVANGIFGGVYYSVQRLCKTRVWSDSLGYLHFFGWQIVCSWIFTTLSSGHWQHRDFAELVWPIDLAILGLLVIFALNLVMTISFRRERHMYPSLWFYLASALAVPPIYALGNLSLPGEGYASESFLVGVSDGFAQNWYAEGLLMFFVVMPTTGLLYYFFPKATSQSLPNYRMIVMQFWMMTALGILASSRWLHFQAIPEWVSSLGMLAGVLLFFPGWVGISTGWKLIRRSAQGGMLNKQPASLYFAAGVCVLAWVVCESALTSFKSVMAVTGLTEWRDANFYAITLGWAGFVCAGSAFVMLPAIHKKTWNPQLIRMQFWISVAGVSVLLVAIYLCGIVQGSMSGQVDGTGTLVYPEFIEIVQTVSALWWVAFFAAVLCCAGAALYMFNVSMSWVQRDRRFQRKTTLAPKLDKHFEAEQPRASQLEGAPVLGLGIKIDQMTQFVWHREWERSIGKFLAAIVIILAVGIGLEFVPVWATSDSASKPSKLYTPLELVGREIYKRERCAACHTQTSRPLVGEVARYGDYSLAKDYEGERSLQWGSRRIGPDLSHEAGRQNGAWHWQHLENPQATSPGSLMPSFQHLIETEFELEHVLELLRREQENGSEYDPQFFEPDELTEEDRLFGEVTPLEAELTRHAEIIAADIVQGGGPAGKLSQEATALIAYLQQLGVD